MRLYSNSFIIREKVNTLLLEKGIEPELRNMQNIDNFTPPPNYPFPIFHSWATMNEAVLEDGDCIVNSGLAICAHIERKYPSPAMFPTEPRAFAFVNYVEELFYASLAANVYLINKDSMAECYSRPEEAKKKIENYLKPTLAFFESRISDHLFLVSDTITIADISIGISMKYINNGYTMVFERLGPNYPRLNELCKRLWARESFAPIGQYSR